MTFYLVNSVKTASNFQKQIHWSRFSKCVEREGRESNALCKLLKVTTNRFCYSNLSAWWTAFIYSITLRNFSRWRKIVSYCNVFKTPSDHTWLQQVNSSRCGGSRRKVTKVIRTHYLGNVNVWAHFFARTSSRYRILTAHKDSFHSWWKSVLHINDVRTDF